MASPGRRGGTPSDLGRLLLGHLASRRDARLQDLATAVLRNHDGRGDRIVAAVNLTIRLRRALTYALHLRPRRALSRVAFTLDRQGRAAAAPANRLSLLCPTRGRVGGVAAFVRSVERTAALPGRVELEFYVDTDDPALPAYQAFFQRAPRRFPRLGACSLRVGAPVGVPAAWNNLAAAAAGDFLLMANDDQLHVDYGWDVKLDRTVARLLRDHPDGILCLYLDGGQYPEGGCDFPILSRRWYQLLGYFTPTIFQQWEVERWVFDIARRVGRLYPVPGALVEHRHYQDYKAPFDATYQRHRMTRQKSLADHALFLRTEPDREREAAKLRRHMKEDRMTTDQTTTTARAAARAGTSVSQYALLSTRRNYGNVIDALRMGGMEEEARQCARLAVEQGLWDHPLQRPREYFPGLPIKPLYDPGELWLTSHLEEAFPRIRAEVDTMLDPARRGFDPMVDERPLLREGEWEQAQFWSAGRRNDSVCARFPVTAAVIAEIPEVTTFGPGVVALSRLYPGTHIAPHCGPTNAVLRVHLGLRIPPGVTIRIGDEVITWEEGRCIAFDDSFEHEVWHRGDQERVVLILDVLHPDLDDGYRRHLLAQRLTFEEQIVSFMRERGIDRIDFDGDDIRFRPDRATGEVVRRYARSTQVRGVELRNGRVHWDRLAEAG